MKNVGGVSRCWLLSSPERKGDDWRTVLSCARPEAEFSSEAAGTGQKLPEAGAAAAAGCRDTRPRSVARSGVKPWPRYSIANLTAFHSLLQKNR